MIKWPFSEKKIINYFKTFKLSKPQGILLWGVGIMVHKVKPLYVKLTSHESAGLSLCSSTSGPVHC